MKPPVLLTKKDLVKSTEQALIRIESIRQRKAVNDDKLILEGLFVLAVSTFENSLNDTIREVLRKIPDKLDIKTETIPKDVIISGDILSYAIENKINNVSYKSIDEIIKYFIRLTSIAEDSIPDGTINRLKEIKATRNLLIHNDLIINGFYKDTAGIFAREPSHNDRLEIGQDYLYQSIVTIRDILNAIKNNLELKYKGYTYINAVKNLFKYIFQTPVMVFENEFNIDQKNDSILSYNSKQSCIESLSSSESLFFNIWLSHFCLRPFEFKPGSFQHLSNNNRKKMTYFLNVIDILKS